MWIFRSFRSNWWNTIFCTNNFESFMRPLNTCPPRLNILMYNCILITYANFNQNLTCILTYIFDCRNFALFSMAFDNSRWSCCIDWIHGYLRCNIHWFQVNISIAFHLTLDLLSSTSHNENYKLKSNENTIYWQIEKVESG